MTSVRTGRSFGRAAARVLRFLPGLFFFAFTPSSSSGVRWVFFGGGFGLFWVEAFEEELELSRIDFFAFDAVEDFDQGVDLLLQDANARSLLGNDWIWTSPQDDPLSRFMLVRSEVAAFQPLTAKQHAVLGNP